MRAYILIEATVGNAAPVVNHIRTLGLPKATTLLSADAVTGPFDIIVLVETTDLDTLVRSVTDRIQLIDGVERTITCVA